MKITHIAFTVERTLPLYPLTKDESDQYANVRPSATCTIEVDADPNTTAGKKQVEAAYAVAQDACFTQLSIFYDSLVGAITPKKR